MKDRSKTVATKSVTFRCPDELLDYIEQQANSKGVDRTTVIVELLQSGVEAIGREGITGVGQPLGNVRRLIQEAIAPLQEHLQTQQAEIEDLRGKLLA